MWNTLFLGAIFLCCYPVIEGNPKQSGSNGCPRTNNVRFCGKTCSTDGDCRGNRKCLCDGDCGMICVKNNLRCEKLPKVKNGRSSFSNGSYFRSVVTYKCKKPYKLRGSAKRTCRATGKWDGTKTRCKTYCPDPGQISFGNRRTERSKGVKLIHFWCYDDVMYKMVGTPRIRCQENGQWSAPKPKCIHSPPLCDKPNIPEEAAVIYPRSMDREFKYGDRVLLKCKEGYFKSGLGVYQCKKGNIWSGGITCSPKSCGRPNDIPNGKIIGYVFSFKEKIRYECNEGYNLKGPSYRTCQANEKWGDKDPICEVADCGSLQKPDHGDIIEQVAFTYGNRIVFDCTETGYEMKGSRVRTCQRDGTWSGSPTTCEIVQCGDPGTPQNGKQMVTKGFVYGGSVEFKCKRGYTLVGKHITYCRTNKQWTAAVPQCRASCQDPGILLHGHKIGNNFSHGQKVSYSCNSNYVLEGAQTSTCSDGRWSNKMPSCRAPCAKPAAPPNGGLWGRDFRHGQSVRFICRSGYQRVGTSPITCNDGKWNKPFPVCKGICHTPRNPNKGKLHKKFLVGPFLDGDVATFSCDNGYDLIGNRRIRCVVQVWNPSVPQCKARCRFSGKPLKGYVIKGPRVIGEMIKHGEKITYDCFASYTMEGSSTQECDNGRWTNDVPKCKASCVRPGSIRNGRVSGKDFGHGKTVSYRCDGNYALEGRSTLTCDDGRWNPNPPVCRASCKDPGSPANGKRQQQGLRHNSWVSFSCDKNYQLEGETQIQCNDGTWSDNLPKCVAVCPDPGHLTNGIRRGKNFKNGSTVTFKCNANHDLIGNDTIRCEDKVWSGDVPICKGKCKFLGNPKNGYTQNGYYLKDQYFSHGSSIKYACDPSYTMDGSSTLHCNDGVWNGSFPSCKASCSDPGYIDRGNRSGRDFSHGKVVIYECTNQTYSLVGNPRLTCLDGKWDSARPSCKSLCNKPGILKNGRVIGRNYSDGSVIKYECNKGYEVRGSPFSTCRRGAWEGQFPECEICVQIGAIFWGLWAWNKGANNYYRAKITRITPTRVDFALFFDRNKKRSYPRSDELLIIDKVPSMGDVSPNSPVIANQFSDRDKKWYRTGNVNRTSGDSLVYVRFDDGEEKGVPLERVRLVSRPLFCPDVK
nr:CUB and sushi domain-containing protein 1-like [Pocillopora verrucosa]